MTCKVQSGYHGIFYKLITCLNIYFSRITDLMHTFGLNINQKITMKKIIILLAIVAAQTSVFAQGTWTVDKMHSSLKFTVTHLSVSDVDGVFGDFDATITTTKADFSDAKFTLTAKVASINTGVGMRDDDL